MALVSNIGLGSGLDITSLVSQLVAAERAAPDAALNRREARSKSEISALGQLSSAFSQLETALERLESGSGFDGRSVSTDSERLGASVAAGASPALGSYQIEITSLATAQKLQSDPTAIAAADTALSAGTLEITVGSDSYTIEVADGDTVYDLAAALNEQAGEAVQATVLRGDDGYSLSLTAAQAGTAGAISIVQTDGGSSLEAFTFDPDAPSPNGLTETVATDAEFYVDGLQRTSSSNTVSDAIDGIELVLVQAEVGESFALTVSEDSSGARQSVEAFVNAYNNTLTVLARVSAFDLDAKTAEPLNGDALVRSATSQLRGFVGNALSAASDAGIEIGLDTQVDGKLSFDAAAFSSALQSDADAVKAIFSGEAAALTTGFSDYVDGLIGTDGVLVQRTDNLNTTLREVTTDRAALDRRMQAIEERYRAQFVALDSLLGQLNNTSQYLAQQLSALPALNS